MKIKTKIITLIVLVVFLNNLLIANDRKQTNNNLMQNLSKVVINDSYIYNTNNNILQEHKNIKSSNYLSKTKSHKGDKEGFYDDSSLIKQGNIKTNNYIMPYDIAIKSKKKLNLDIQDNNPTLIKNNKPKISDAKVEVNFEANERIKITPYIKYTKDDNLLSKDKNEINYGVGIKFVE